jgi:hypothetical protein
MGVLVLGQEQKCCRYFSKMSLKGLSENPNILYQQKKHKRSKNIQRYKLFYSEGEVLIKIMYNTIWFLTK